MIQKEYFGEYEQYVLRNEELEVAVTTLGAMVTRLKYKGVERAVCYATPEEALIGKGFLCKTVGRYANRIGNASFTLDGVKYDLPANEGANQLHGGPDSYDKRIWNAEVQGDSVLFSIFSPDGDNGFPGNFIMTIRYSLSGGTVRIDFGGATDKATVYAPTVHHYFNLNDSESVLDAKLQVNATGHLEVDSGLIPTGKVLPCEGKFALNELRVLGEDLDDCFLTPEEQLCILEMGDCRLETWSDMPAVQIYTGISLPAPFRKNQGIAIEPEFYPDSPNHPEFPSAVLRPGESFSTYIEYRFSEV